MVISSNTKTEGLKPAMHQGALVTQKNHRLLKRTNKIHHTGPHKITGLLFTNTTLYTKYWSKCELCKI